VKDGASDMAAEKSSYEVISEIPVVDMVKDEPDILRVFMDWSKFIESPSIWELG